MKKHPVIKFSLIMIISAAFGALCSSLLSNHTDSITGAVGAFNRWFGAQTGNPAYFCMPVPIPYGSLLHPQNKEQAQKYHP